MERLTLSTVLSGLDAGSQAECVAGQVVLGSRAAAQASSRVRLTFNSLRLHFPLG